MLWSGTIAFANVPQPGQFRVVVAEYEVLQTDLSTIGSETLPAYRLVYTCILPYDYPSTPPN